MSYSKGYVCTLLASYLLLDLSSIQISMLVTHKAI